MKSLVCNRHHEDGHLLWSKGWRDLFSLSLFSPAIDLTVKVYSSSLLDIWKKMRVEERRSTPFKQPSMMPDGFFPRSAAGLPLHPLFHLIHGNSTHWWLILVPSEYSALFLSLSLRLFVSRPVCFQLSERRENQKGIMHMVCVGVRTSVLFYRRDPLFFLVRYESRAGKVLMRTHFSNWFWDRSNKRSFPFLELLYSWGTRVSNKERKAKREEGKSLSLSFTRFEISPPSTFSWSFFFCEYICRFFVSTSLSFLPVSCMSLSRSCSFPSFKSTVVSPSSFSNERKERKAVVAWASLEMVHLFMGYLLSMRYMRLLGLASPFPSLWLQVTIVVVAVESTKKIRSKRRPDVLRDGRRVKKAT